MAGVLGNVGSNRGSQGRFAEDTAGQLPSRGPQGTVKMCMTECRWHPHLIFGCPSFVHKHIFDAIPAEGAPPGQQVRAHVAPMQAC